MLLIMYIELPYWFGYDLFSALIINHTNRSGSNAYFPLHDAFPGASGSWLSYMHKLPLTAYESILGAVFGYAVLWIIAQLFHKIRKIEGLGQGDIDLLALIGAFTGVLGAWISLFIGAF